MGVRVAILRSGLVLSRAGGFLGKLLPLFRLGAGGHVGTGKQWLPWIHIDDEIALIRHAMAASSVSGVLNAVAPEPVTNAEFTKALGRVLRRPVVLAAPAFALRVALGGEMAEELLLARPARHARPHARVGLQVQAAPPRARRSARSDLGGNPGECSRALRARSGRRSLPPLESLGLGTSERRFSACVARGPRAPRGWRPTRPGGRAASRRRRRDRTACPRISRSPGAPPRRCGTCGTGGRS